GQGAVALAIAGEPGSAVAGNDLARGTGESAGADPADVLEEYLAAPIPEKMAPPDSFKLESCRPHDEFLEQVAAAVTEVRSGRLSKVVLAREVRVEANRPLRQEDLLERLRSLHPSCTAFAVEGFIGASPELLIKLDGRAVESHPLAGTAARSGDPVADAAAETALLTSPKERAEHRAVVDSIAGGLAPAVAELEVPEGPAIVELRNVSHLGTHIKGRLAVNGSRPPNSLQLLALIHPTPAVSGTPIGAAIEYLATAEGLDRDKYAGAVGWIDAAGDGEWHLGIRCAIVDGRTARLFAGVGIVADSDPAAELRETQLKLQAFLAAAVRP
ncbi:MAG TPA: isochorismate synthase, partial [Acidimicrobiales bacterium]|nr:isochorismate synthase [Acidimicrobiales bacterium]